MLKNMEISTMMHMPDDIIAEILPWLPANSLLRFRWACKYWFNLITESSFVKKHLFRSNNSSSRLWVLDYTKFYLTRTEDFTQCYVDYTTGVFSRQVTMVAYPFIKFHRIFGACHGLILCVCSSIDDTTATLVQKLYILNPCTKEYKEIHSAPPLDQDFYRYPYDKFCYVFGSDCTTDDYKVIRFANNWSYDGSNYENKGVILQVYTLGTNSWRSIGTIPYTLLPHPNSMVRGVSVNGAVYWRNYSKTNIVCFDIGKERYEEITSQPVCFHDNLKNGKLVMFEGSLSVILRIDDTITGTNYVEMWVMKDTYCVNSNESSWTKLLRTKPSVAYTFMFLKPLRFTKSGEIVLMNKWGSLFSYDPKNPTATVIAFKRTWGKEEHRTVWVENENIVYIESLVSLNSGTYAVEKHNKLTET